MKLRGTMLQDDLYSENEVNLFKDWLLQWGLPDGRGLMVKSDYAIFTEVT